MIRNCCARKSFVPGTDVPPLSTLAIARKILPIRGKFCSDDDPLDVELALDYCTQYADASYEFVCRTEFEKFPNASQSEALWDSQENKIWIPEDLESLIGELRYRFTISHEISHMLLCHKPRILLQGRGTPIQREQVPIFQDPEWQADKGASFLLMSTNGILNLDHKTPLSISSKFRVSYQSAEIMLKDLRRFPPGFFQEIKAQEAATS